MEPRWVIPICIYHKYQQEGERDKSENCPTLKNFCEMSRRSGVIIIIVAFVVFINSCLLPMFFWGGERAGGGGYICFVFVYFIFQFIFHKSWLNSLWYICVLKTHVKKLQLIRYVATGWLCCALSLIDNSVSLLTKSQGRTHTSWSFVKELFGFGDLS